MTSKLTLLFVLFSMVLSAQETYFKLPLNKQLFSTSQYEKIETAIKAGGQILPKIVKSEIKSDSIIKTIGFFNIQSGKRIDVVEQYESYRGKIGTTFKIEQFKDKDGNHYPADYLENKPSLINFWFTSCSPCIEEIPNLNIIKSRFKDSANFIAITYEKNKTVDRFLKTRPINFEHIVNSQRQLNQMDIKYYPMTLLLDKEGKIVEVYGQINIFEEEIIDELQKLVQ